MQIQKPPHDKYALRNADQATYTRLYVGYSNAKKVGFRSAVAYLKRLGYAIVGGLGWVNGPLVPIIINLTKVLKVARFTHRATSELDQEIFINNKLTEKHVLLIILTE